MTRTHYCDLFAPFVARLEHQIALDPEDASPLAQIAVQRKSFDAGTKIYAEADEERHLYIVKSGWLFGYSDLQNGTRYIHRIYQPGDIIGMEDTNWNYATSSVQAVTQTVLGCFPKEDQYKIFSGKTRLAAAFYGVAMNDHVVLVDTARANSRLDALGRVSHLLLSIEARQALNEPLLQGSFFVPLTQTQIADCVGLSQVQVNKSLQRLSQASLIHRTKHRYQIADRPALLARTGFTNRYIVTNARWLDLMVG